MHLEKRVRLLDIKIKTQSLEGRKNTDMDEHTHLYIHIYIHLYLGIYKRTVCLPLFVIPHIILYLILSCILYPFIQLFNVSIRAKS